LAQARSTRDLLKLALQHSGELTDGTSPYHQIGLQYINRINKDVLAGSNALNTDIGERWVWARERLAKSLILEPKYSTGTVSLTNGTAAGTFSVPPAFSAKDRYLKVTTGNRPTYYRIVAHTASVAAFTIDAQYVEETSVDLAYDAIQLIYELDAEILRLVEPFRIYDTQSDTHFFEDDATEGKIYSIDVNRFRTEYPLKSLKDGIPSRFTIIHEADTELVIQFNGHPTKQVKVDFDWIKKPEPLLDTDSSIPLIPWEFREVLAFGSAYYLLKDKSDDKAETFLQLAQAALFQMKKAAQRQDSDTDKDIGHLFPREEQLDKFSRRRFF